jgi:hypothetical protein
MAGAHTLQETEHAIQERLGDLPVNLQAMAGVSNIYRAAGAVRNHLERTVLAPHDLTWTGWVVPWVIWVWKDIEKPFDEVDACGVSGLFGVEKPATRRGVQRDCLGQFERWRLEIECRCSWQWGRPATADLRQSCAKWSSHHG